MTARRFPPPRSVDETDAASWSAMRGFRRNRQRQFGVPVSAVRRLPMMNFVEEERVSSAWARLTITLMVAYATIVMVGVVAIIHS
jgi:hypothetical protein